METKNLLEMLDYHKMLVGPNVLYLRANKGTFTVASSSPVGTKLVTRLETTANFPSLAVEASVFYSFVKGNKQLDFTTDTQRLLLRGKGTVGEIPFSEVEEFPKIPIIENVLSKSDISWLTAIIPLTVIKSLDKSGFFAASCKNGKWAVCCSDNIHGAFAFSEGESNIEFCLTPTDAFNINNVLKRMKDPKIKVEEGTVYIQDVTNTISVAVPLIEGNVESREKVVKGQKLAGKINLDSFKEAIKMITPIATAKDAPAIEFNLDQKSTIKASSASGSLLRKLVATCSSPVNIQLSFDLINRLLPLFGGKEISLFYVEDGDAISRISIKSNGVYYLMLTSV